MRSKDTIMHEINKKQVEEIEELHKRLYEEAHQCKNVEMKTRLMLRMGECRKALKSLKVKHGY